MRTTIRLDDTLLRRAKAQAAASGRTLNDFIADAVRAALARRAPAEGRPDLPTFTGAGLQQGVDLDDSAALLELMENAGAYGRDATARGAVRKVAERRRRRTK